jgi:transcriptional regulator with XRE-family HTH domain
MAKIKVASRPGALSELLKSKGMTQMDAFEKTRVDRKTLRRIDRGAQVKLEKLQQVANRLQVPEGYFSHQVSPPAAADNSDVSSALEPGTIMLRKLDWRRLEELLNGAKDVRWHLRAQVRDDMTHKFLEEFEQAIENFRRQLRQLDFDSDARDGDPSSLRFQLNCLKTTDDIAARLERLADHSVVLLGADYLFWDCGSEDYEYESTYWTNVNYRSSRIVLLSVEPAGTQSRRARIYQGSLPPRFAPNTLNTPYTTNVFVNGVQLPTLDSDIPPSLDESDIPF